jgi:hypothetical protein
MRHRNVKDGQDFQSSFEGGLWKMQAPYYHEGSNCDLEGFIASLTVRAPTPGMIHYCSVPVSVLYKPSLDYTIHVFPQISSTA